MGEACSTCGDKRFVYGVLVGKPDRQRPLGRHKLRWEDNIKMDLQGVGWQRGLGRVGSGQGQVSGTFK